MKKRMILPVCMVLLVWMGAGLYLKALVKEAANITVSELNLETVTDGIYEGEYAVPPVYVKVEVAVTGRRITGIKIIEHQNGLGGKAEKIVDAVISRQSLEVDTVSGATVSSKCIIKAIENALQRESE